MTEHKMRAIQCRRCGRRFNAAAARGRPPVVCEECRQAYETEQISRRVRRWRGSARTRANEGAHVRELQAQYFANRLADLHPEAAAILAREVPPGLAEDIIQALTSISKPSESSRLDRQDAEGEA
jgi:hypothetical protein